MERIDIDVISRAGRGFYGGRFRDKLIQSVCHDGKNYYVGFSWMNDARMSTIAVMKDLGFRDESVLRTADLPLFHCNDMEYNRTDGKIYVATGGKKIVIVRPDTLTVAGERELHTEAWSIAKNSAGRWYVFNGDELWEFTENFVASFRIGRGYTERMMKEAGDGYWQGMFFADGTPYLIWSVKDAKPDHYKGTVLFSEKETLYAPGDREIEGAVIVDGNAEFVYGQLSFGGAYRDMNSEMKTVYKEFTGVPAAAGNITVGMGDAVPDGYELTAAEVNVKKGSQWRALPYLNGSGKIALQVLKVSGKKVVLKAAGDLGTVQLQVTGFCRRV